MGTPPPPQQQDHQQPPKKKVTKAALPEHAYLVIRYISIATVV